jgi:hypothetical protein
MLCGPLGMKQVGPANEDLLLCAISNLRSQFAVVGLTERMAETACLVSSTLGLAHLEQGLQATPKVNANAESSEVGSEAQQVPDFYVNQDLQLYREAEILFEEQLDRYPHCRLSAERAR